MKISTYLIGLLLCASFSANAQSPSTALPSAETSRAEAPSVQNSAGIWLYTINKNDSFELIYQKYLNKRTNILALSEYNQHKLTKKLKPGQVISIPVEMLKRTPTPAQVIVVYGDVLATTLSSNQRKINKGDSLTQGDTVQTGKNSLAKLLFADSSVIEIQSNSSLSIVDSFKYAGKETYVTNVKLTRGRTSVAANPNHAVGNTMQVATPSAIAAVRGTQFRVGADGDIALQETLEGQVAFSASGQEILLAKGYGSLAEKDKAPLPPIVLPSAPDVSAFPKLMESIPVVFNLAPQQDAAAWVSQLALDAEFTQIVNEQVIQTTSLSFADLADGQYYLKLRAQDSHGLQGSDAVHAFSVKVRAPEPVLELLEPQDSEVIPLAPTELSWKPMPNANNYIVQIARDKDFANIVYERHASFNKLTINQSFGAGEFYWRVAVLIHGKPQKFSKMRKFSR